MLVPRVGVGGVVLAEHGPLHLEEVLGIAHVRQQILRHGTTWLHGSGVHLLPGLQDGVVGLPGIQLDRAVVGVHDGLDTVADVVDLGATLGDPVSGRGVGGGIAQIDLGGVRVVRGGRVPVDDPHHAPVDDSGQGVAVHGEPRGNLGDPVTGLAVVEDLGVRVHPVREQQVDVGHLGGVHGTQHRIADGHPTVSGIGGHGLGPGSCRTTTGSVELNGFCPVSSTDDHPGIRHLAVVDA